MSDETAIGRRIKQGRIWVFAGSCFHKYYEERCVTHRFDNLDQAANYYYYEDGYFESPIDLCIAPFPYEPKDEESKLFLNPSYVFLTEDGFAPAWNEPTYKIKPLKSLKSLTDSIKKYLEKNGETYERFIVAGVSFDLTKLVEQVSHSVRSNAAQDLIEKWGLKSD